MSGTSKVLSIVGSVFNIIAAIFWLIFAFLFISGNPTILDAYNSLAEEAIAQGGNVIGYGEVANPLLEVGIFFLVIGIIVLAAGVTKIIACAGVDNRILVVLALVLSILSADIFGIIGTSLALINKPTNSQ